MRKRGEAPRYFERPAGIVALWFGFLAGPTAWFLHLNISYALVVYVCRSGEVWLLHLATLGTVLLAAAGVLVALGSWRRLFRRVAAETEIETETGERGDREGRLDGEDAVLRRSDPADPATGRTRLLALGGIGLGGFFLAIIVVAWIPDLVLSPCEGRI